MLSLFKQAFRHTPVSSLADIACVVYKSTVPGIEVEQLSWAVSG